MGWVVVYADPLTAYAISHGGCGACAYEGIKHYAARWRKQADDPLSQFFGKLGFVAVVASHGGYLPNSARTPIGPFVGTQAVAVVLGYAWLPEDINMFKLVHRAIGVGMPSAVSPARVFVPNPLVVEIEPRLFSPLHHQASSELDLGRCSVLAASDIVVFQPTLDSLLAAAQKLGQFVAAGIWVFLLGLKNLLFGDCHLLASHIIGLESRHGLVGEAEDVADIDRHETARLNDASVAVDDLSDEFLPIFKTEMPLVRLAHIVRRRPEAERNAVGGQASEHGTGIASHNAIETELRA